MSADIRGDRPGTSAGERDGSAGLARCRSVRVLPLATRAPTGHHALPDGDGYPLVRTPAARVSWPFDPRVLDSIQALRAFADAWNIGGRDRSVIESLRDA